MCKTKMNFLPIIGYWPNDVCEGCLFLHCIEQLNSLELVLMQLIMLVGCQIGNVKKIKGQANRKTAIFEQIPAKTKKFN